MPKPFPCLLVLGVVFCIYALMRNNMIILWLTLFCFFVGIPFYWFIYTNDISKVTFKRRYYPLFIKASLGIIAGVFIVHGWMVRSSMKSFLGYVCMVLFVAVVIGVHMTLRIEFCDKCGATNMYLFIGLQDRNHCQKCGERLPS